MARPLKPWEKARPAAGSEPHGEGELGLVTQVDEKFPDDDVETPGGQA